MVANPFESTPNKTPDTPKVAEVVSQPIKSPYEKSSGGFSSVINKYSNSPDIVLRQHVSVLKQLESTLSSQNIAQVDTILENMSSVDDYGKINAYIVQLKEIAKQYTSEKKEKSKETKKGTKQMSKELLDNAVSYVFGSESLNKIEAIGIDGDVDSIADLDNRMSRLTKLLPSLPEFKQLEEYEQKAIIANLNRLKQTARDNHEKSWGFLEDHFDDFGKQIDKQEDGRIYLDVGGTTPIEFEDKNEAFAFVETFKSEAEDTMQSLGRDMAEGAWWCVTSIFWKSFDFLTVPYELAEDVSISNLANNLKKDTSAFEWFFDSTLSVLALLGSINYSETLFRRMVTDTMAKVGLDKGVTWSTTTTKDKDGKIHKKRTRKIIRLPDFNISQNFYNDPDNAYLRDEYIQRVNAIARMEETLKTLSGEKAEQYASELKKTKTYLNVNTDTFWLKAYSLDKGHGMIKRFGISVSSSPKGWPTGKTFKDISTRYFNLDDNAKQTLERGLDFAFDDTKLEIDADGKITGVTGGIKESQNLQDIKNYVLSRTDLSHSQKDERIKRLDNYIKGLLTVPRGEDAVKRELVDIAKNGLLSKDDVKAKIEQKLYGKYPVLEEIKRGHDLTWKEMKQKLVLKLKEGYGKVGPGSLTSGDSMLFKFASLVEQDLWQGNEQDLKKVFQQVDDGRLEVKQSYAGKKLQLITELFTGIKNKYGLNIPEISKLKKFASELSDADLKEVLDAGTDISKVQAKLAQTIDRGIELGNTKYYPVQAINNYIDYALLNHEELSRKPNLDAFLTDIKDRNILYGELEFFRELNKIQDGFIPSYKLLEKLENLKKADGITPEQKTNIDFYIEQAQKGKLNFTKHDVEQLGIHHTAFDATKSYIADDFDVKSQEDFIKGLETMQDLHKYDFKGSLGASGETTLVDLENKLKSTYKVELEYIAVLHKIEGTKSTVAFELTKFAENLHKNNYSNGQAKSILSKIFIGEQFAKVDLDEIVHNTSNHTDKFDVTQDLKDLLKSQFDSLDDVRKNSLLDFIKDNNIAKDTLPQNIKDALDIDSKSGEFNIQRAELERMKGEIGEAYNDAELGDIKREFDSYIKDKGVDRTREPFKQIISDFTDELKQKRRSFDQATPEKIPEKKTQTTDLETQKQRAKKVFLLLDKAYLYAMSISDEAAMKQIEAEGDRINNTKDSRLNQVLNQVDLKQFYMKEFGLPALETKLKLSEIRAKLAKQHPDFAKANTQSQLVQRIKSISDINTKKAIMKQIKNLNITR